MADQNEFGHQEAGNLVENNLVISASVVLEQVFEQSFRQAFEIGADWKLYSIRAAVAFIVYNGIKAYSLYRRDKHGWSGPIRFGSWLWVKIFGSR